MFLAKQLENAKLGLSLFSNADACAPDGFQRRRRHNSKIDRYTTMITTMTTFSALRPALLLLCLSLAHGEHEHKISDARALRRTSLFNDHILATTASNPFTPLNQHCRNDCVGPTAAPASHGGLEPDLSSCPQCDGNSNYGSQHCNSCCDAGASSLRLR
jgi:hypothetical protein